MSYLAKYYNDLDLGFLYHIDGMKELPVATFYPNDEGSSWRFVQPPNELGRTFREPDMKLAISDFLLHIGIAREHHELVVEHT